MYTLVLIVIGLGVTTTPSPTIATTSFTVADVTVCKHVAATLSQQSTKSIQIHTYCVPRVEKIVR